MNISDILSKLTHESLFFTPEALLKIHHLSPSEIHLFIATLKKQGKIQAIYRLKTEERFPNYDNDWTPHLQELCKNFKTIKGEFIDGSEFSNLEFKFKILDF